METLFQNKEKIFYEGVVQVFDSFTKYYKENRYHDEGWKTNKKYKVNRKVIHPHFIQFSRSWDGKSGSFNTYYSWSQIMDDIDKVLCMLSGNDFGEITTIYNALCHKFKQLGSLDNGEKYDNTCESFFFDIRFFKKGTVHLHFKDKFLWQEFNLKAIQHKRWLTDDNES